MRFTKRSSYLLNSLPKIVAILALSLWAVPVFALQALTAHTLFYKKNQAGVLSANVVICWQANAASVHFERNKDNNFDATVLVALRLSNDTGIFKEETFVVKTAPKPSQEEAAAQNVSDQYEYTLPEGHYELEMVLVQDYYRNEVYEYKDTFSIAPVKKVHPFLSGIQLIDTVIEASQKTTFSRNGHIELPLASNYYDEQNRVIKYYTELYNTGDTADIKMPLVLNSYISYLKFAPPVASLEHHDTLRGETFMHRSFPLEALKSGNYYLNVVLTDSKQTVLDKQYLFIQRFNQHPVEPAPDTSVSEQKATRLVKANGDGFEEVNVLDLTKTFVAKYNAAQVRAILKMLALIAEPAERASLEGFLRKPDELYSKYFIYNFWEKRNKKDPEAAWKAYADKIREVNRMFSVGSRQGFETDRGRIYIKYGKPDDRNQIPNEPGAMPYELWQYYSIGKGFGNVVFLFYKSGKSIGGNYELLHSTMVGETRNLNWRAFLYSNSSTGNGSVNKDSQAEQYIGTK